MAATIKSSLSMKIMSLHKDNVHNYHRIKIPLSSSIDYDKKLAIIECEKSERNYHYQSTIWYRYLIELQALLFLIIDSFMNKYLLSCKRTKHHYRSMIVDNFCRQSSHLFTIFVTLIICLLPMFIQISYVADAARTNNECRFPEHWWGSWFQKGVSGTISITMNNISHKGFCRKNHGDKYIIENRTDRCVRCLVISERHANILQYKETSFCYPLSEDTNEICFDINGDAPLYSLFRGIMNECRDPPSTIDQCTDDRHLLFKFRACIDIHGSESKVEELECLADWKEGSYRYLVGKLYHQLATTDEDRFRCFVFERNNSDYVESYNIGQSGDASCEGLFSPRDGSRTFKLRKTNSIQSSCEFPPWITDVKLWSTLDNRHVYDFTALNQFTVVDMKQTVFQLAKCIRSDDVSFQYRFNTSRFIIHTTVQCSSGYACMNAYQREDRITELQIGNIVSDINEACSPNNFNLRPANFITLTTLDQEMRPCELSGIYSIRTRMPYSYNHKIMTNYSRLVSLLDSRFMCQEKDLKLRSNCEEPEMFQFICTTDNRIKNFYCRGGWRENNTQYFLVSLIDKFNYGYCISYNIENKEIRLIRNSHFCYRNDQILQNYDQTQTPSRSFRPSVVIGDQYPTNKFASTKYDDSISFTLINEGSCQRSSSVSFIGHSCRKLFLLWLFIIIVVSFHSKA
ncbi:hypothetical protein DERP_001285 [Dermatophagoides pteronyssinus]|uniref:Uncharacterized protein n=1 Tax=Dermatophagoides pteronyssinus TaxID=6956 RepID=A0ABQ8JET0_DERPT|nr:hypothetical protein DERP_001285 [Dermatophagoides pteronyssinus]